MRVLIVEDERVMAEAVRDGLRLEAIAADITHDGEAALEALTINDYDAIVLDRDIPRVTGDDVARWVMQAPGRARSDRDGCRCRVSHGSGTTWLSRRAFAGIQGCRLAFDSPSGLAFVGGWFLAGHILQPLTAISSVAHRGARWVTAHRRSPARRDSD